MSPVHVKILNWPTTILRVLLVSFIHPSGLLVSELLGRKPLSPLPFAVVFLPLYLFYFVLQVAPIVWASLRGETQEVMADSSGLKIKAFRRSRHIAWAQIATLEKTQVPSGKSLQDILTLRDAGGIIQIQFKRNLQEGTKLKEQYDQLEALIVGHVGAKGLISTNPLETTLTQTSFALNTRLKILGLGSLLFWFPCTYFSWNARTGGPAVGSIFLGFAVLGVVISLFDKRYEVDEQGVRVFWLYKREELRWEEVRRIGMTQNSTSLVFVSGQRVVNLLGPANWKEGTSLMQFLQSKIRVYNIEWEPNVSVKWFKELRSR